MLHVAFMRNANQGQRGMPATADILTAFQDAGATWVATFQSNGTIVFDADDPQGVVDDMRAALETRSTFHGAILTTSLAFVADVVERQAEAPDVDRRELTLFRPDLEIVDAVKAAERAAYRRCTIIDHGPGWAVLSNERDRESNGTPVIEDVVGTPATSRGLPTLTRLVDRFAE